MKKLIIALTFALCCTPAFAVCPVANGSQGNTSATYTAEADKVSKKPKSRKAKTRREVRQAKHAKTIDSLIMSDKYRFKPSIFRMNTHEKPEAIRDAASQISLVGDYCEIRLPYYIGMPPFYRLSMLNAATHGITDYAAVKTDDGWNISFKAKLFASENYEFSLTVVSKTGFAELIVSVPYKVTMSYSGSIMELP